MLQILHEDDSIVVVNKPSGLPTIPANNMPRRESLAGEIEELIGKKIFIVHRLDRETSGAVIFAKTPEAHKDLNMQFEQRKVMKYYLALVEGQCDFAEKEINIPLSKSKSKSGKPALASKGLEAVTRVKTLRNFESHALLEVMPLTGRRHQIRLHLKAVGHPLAFDRLYGRKEHFPLSLVTRNPKDQAVAVCRLPLHAYRISFAHPGTQQKLDVTAPLPEDFGSISDFLFQPGLFGA